MLYIHIVDTKYQGFRKMCKIMKRRQPYYMLSATVLIDPISCQCLFYACLQKSVGANRVKYIFLDNIIFVFKSFSIFLYQYIWYGATARQANYQDPNECLRQAAAPYEIYLLRGKRKSFKIQKPSFLYYIFLRMRGLLYLLWDMGCSHHKLSHTFPPGE